ncbi:hypothetical protein RRF57_005190 [Xylaria bambusicola]|uniref:Uncharacterized protein n=1 Tax=Xylaria bambusicola TaxID=326684 RepID=A0AAN7UBS1_9PEZI
MYVVHVDPGPVRPVKTRAAVPYYFETPKTAQKLELGSACVPTNPFESLCDEIHIKIFSSITVCAEPNTIAILLAYGHKAASANPMI